MKLPSTKAALVTLALLIGFALEIGGSSNLVLCLGEDGHVAVEAASDGLCGQQSKESLNGTGQFAGIQSKNATDHCGPCVDIPLISSIGSKEKILAAHKVDLTNSLVLLQSALNFEFAVAPPLLHARQSNFPAPVTPAARKTVVLLI